ncbi:MAG: hypothetical protein R3B45_08880 [Bdellovibrionota bacterium]
MSKHFKKIIKSIEVELSEYYGFAIDHSASDHLVNEDEIKILQPNMDGAKIDRAGVLFQQEQSEVFIGLHFNSLIKDSLQLDPTHCLCNKNLDAFTVVVEELSHFHLLLNRMRANQKLSQLELEWQAEIDKILISGLFLQKSAGDPHIHALKKLIIDRSIITSNDEELYFNSSKYAHRFWQDFIDYAYKGKNSLIAKEFQKFMQLNYEKPMDLKKLYSNAEPIMTAA